MDLTIKTNHGYFNCRVAGVIKYNNKILFQKGEIYYLPGRRVKFSESCEETITRELKEELGIVSADIKPIWINEVFFEENGIPFREIGFYYYVDVKESNVMNFYDDFSTVEDGRINHFCWIDIDDVKKADVYPLFIKDEINNIGDNLKMISSREL